MSMPTFEGTEEQQALAAEVFHLMTMQAAFFASDAPIRQSLGNLTDFLATRHATDPAAMSKQVDAALSLNTQVFQREQNDSEITYITSRNGFYVPRQIDMSHMFTQRLYEPETPLPVDDISVVVSTSRPALTTVEPVFISDYWQEQAGLSPAAYDEEDGFSAAPVDDDEAFAATAPDSAETVLDQQLVSIEDPDSAEPVEPAEALTLTDDAALVADEAPAPPELADSEALSTQSLEPVEPPQPAYDDAVLDRPDEPVAADAGHAVVEPSLEVPSAAEEAPETPVLRFQQDTLLPLTDNVTIDLSQPVETLLEEHGPLLQRLLLDKLDQDPLRRLVHFGTMVYPGDNVTNLGKNDLRRIRDYIIEAGAPLTDVRIIEELYYHSQRQSDYESFRFSLNYRLNREKDFEYVGVPGANLWATRGLPALGTRRVKASEMAHLTAYLVDGFDDSLESQSAEEILETGELTRALTFFEWAYGVLPLDASLATLLPPPVLPEQRSAVLRFESPQHYSTYLVEMRFPSHNRGGWLHGLEEFFAEYLVAGAMLTIGRTDEPDVFTMSYEEMPEDSDRLLILDEKKNRLTFNDTSFFVGVEESMLPSQKQYGKLKNLKTFPLNDRRKQELMLQHVFEVMGDQVGTRNEPAYELDMDTLYVAYNVLRPASRSYLVELLNTDSHLYRSDPDIPEMYTYTPEPKEEEEEEEKFSLWKDEDFDDDE